MSLTQREVDAYRTDGYLILPPCFQAAELAALKDEVAKEFVIDSERRLAPTRPLPSTITWSSSCRSSIRSSLPARDVETQHHLDDRTLLDRLRSLHRHLDGH